MVVNEEQAGMVRWIFQAVLSGKSPGTIARELNGRRVPSKRGGKWTGHTINGMIRNEKYTGDVILQKTYTDDRFNRHVNRGEKDAVIPLLQENIREVLESDTEERLAKVDAAIKEKQAELLDAGKDQKRIDEIGDAIISLREERQDILTEAAKNIELKERVDDLAAFLGEQTEALTEYSETLVRRLIEKITVYDEKLTVEFKSGLEIDVEA